MLLADSPHLQLVATATDGAEGLQLIRSARPDLAIVDINLPGLDGIELVRRVRAQDQDIGLVLTSGGNVAEDARLSLQAGANAYVGKAESPILLTAALLLVRRGYLAAPGRSIGTLGVEEAMCFGVLTKREFRVHQLLCEGYGNGEIAQRLGISPKTVSSFKNRIAKKMEISVRSAPRSGARNPG
jgi:DNA-binding NarL/FixJ family response regulator